MSDGLELLERCSKTKKRLEGSVLRIEKQKPLYQRFPPPPTGTASRSAEDLCVLDRAHLVSASANRTSFFLSFLARLSRRARRALSSDFPFQVHVFVSGLQRFHQPSINHQWRYAPLLLRSLSAIRPSFFFLPSAHLLAFESSSLDIPPSHPGGG